MWNKHEDNEQDSVKDIPMIYVNYFVIVIIVSVAPHIMETEVRNVEQLDYSHITLIEVYRDMLFHLVPTYKCDSQDGIHFSVKSVLCMLQSTLTSTFCGNN
jgi:hypothetical protein